MADEKPPEPIGSVLDALGVRCYLGDGELVSGAVVLLEVAKAGGGTYMQSLSSPMSWITRTGMLEVAAYQEKAGSSTGPASEPRS